MLSLPIGPRRVDGVIAGLLGVREKTPVPEVDVIATGSPGA